MFFSDFRMRWESLSVSTRLSGSCSASLTQVSYFPFTAKQTVGRQTQTERPTNGHIQKGRQTDTDTGRHRQTDADSQIDRHRQRGRQTDTDRETNRRTQAERQTDGQRQSGWQREEQTDGQKQIV